MPTVSDLIAVSMDGIPGIFSLVLGLLILRLRLAAGRSPTTQTQRWGMTFLAWLFLANGLVGIVGLASMLAASPYLATLSQDLTMLPPVFLIGFALVFPRPLVRPTQFRPFLLLLVLLMALFLGREVANNSSTSIVATNDLFNYTFYAIIAAWFIALFRWLRLYEQSGTRREVSMVTTLLIWGFLLYIIMRYNMWGVLSPNVGLGLSGMVIVTFSAIAVGRILFQLYRRRGMWGQPERVHLVMIIATVVLSVIWSAQTALFGPGEGGNLLSAVTTGFMLVVGTNIVRPALICYALLRYQFFGYELRIERGVTAVATLMIAYYGALFISLWFFPMGFPAQFTVLLVAFAVLLLPALMAARHLVRKVMPSAHEMTRAEAREVYYMTFQGAVFRGEVGDPEDAAALADLRERLGLTEREHALLMEGERHRERAGMPVNRIRYTLLVDESGRLVARVGPAEDSDVDQDVLAGMLMAVRQFVSDAFKRSAGDLDTLQYGDRKLLMEKGGGYVLAASPEGAADPAFRSVLGDMIAIILKRHGNILDNWSGNLTEAEPVRAELQRLVDTYNLGAGLR